MSLNAHDSTYHLLLEQILGYGVVRKNRTGVDTIGIFGEQLTFDLDETFPALTTKAMAWKAIVSELIWFLSGSNDERYLAHILHGDKFEFDDKNMQASFDSHPTIWTANVEADYWVNKKKQKYRGDTGRVYGVQWRHWKTPDGGEVDQITNLINSLKNDPFSRRHILNAWNVGEIDNMCLPPCHMISQFNVTNDGYLDCMMFQSSVDVFLGLPFNIASYALLTEILAAHTGLKAGKLVMALGDVHIYSNHVDQVKEQLTRESYPSPKLEFTKKNSMFDYKVSDFTLKNYKSHPSIKAPMAV